MARRARAPSMPRPLSRATCTGAIRSGYPAPRKRARNGRPRIGAAVEVVAHVQRAQAARAHARQRGSACSSTVESRPPLKATSRACPGAAPGGGERAGHR
jgi:hypothetical protein